MGQYWVFLNLDKRESCPVNGTKYGEFFANDDDSIVLFVDALKGWHHDRVLLVGDYSGAHPPRTISSHELQRFVRRRLRFSSKYAKKRGEAGAIPNKSDIIEAINVDACPYWCGDTFPPSPWYGNIPSAGQNICLVNFSHKEYIRQDSFDSYEDDEHPCLTQALYAMVAWTQDPSMSLPGPQLFQQGPWAGARLGIMDVEDIEKKSGFVDVTKQTFFQVHTILTLDKRHNPADCDHPACLQLDELKKARYNPYSETKNPEPASESELEGEQESQVFTSGTSAVVRTHDHSKLELFPMELHGFILEDLPRSAISAYARTSRTLYTVAIFHLYKMVTLHAAHQTAILRHTLTSKSYLCDAITELTVTINPHHASRADMHSILLRLPNLTRLKISASWITYGPLKSSRYPFKLRYLYWGLIVDPAMNRFLKSQPSIEHFELPNYAIRPSEWFYFWRDLLPNVQKITAPSTLETALESLKVYRSRQCMVEYYPYHKLRVDEELAETDQGGDSDEGERYPTDFKEHLIRDDGREESPLPYILSGSESDAEGNEAEQEAEVAVDSTEATQKP